MKVYELMRTGFLAVRPESSVASCRERFAVHHVGLAPVVEGANVLVGFVTRYDLYWGYRVPPPDGRAALVRDVMTSPAVSVPEEHDVRSAASLLSRLGLEALPVTRAGRLVGLLSCGDLCGAVARGQLRDPLDLVLGPQPGQPGARIWRAPRPA
jgi:CBS domain-containing protein